MPGDSFGFIAPPFPNTLSHRCVLSIEIQYSYSRSGSKGKGCGGLSPFFNIGVNMKILFLLSMLCLCAFGDTYHRGSEKRIVRQIEADIDSRGMIALAERTNFALDSVVRRATAALKDRGYARDALRFETEWETKHFGSIMLVKDLGDHQALSKFLTELYDFLIKTIGEKAVKWLHLHSIYVFNYSIPVVFRPCNSEWDKRDYNLHFTPFVSHVGYWCAYIGCMAATSGIGSFFCGPIGMGCEWILDEYVAPKISDRLYDRICK